MVVCLSMWPRGEDVTCPGGGLHQEGALNRPRFQQDEKNMYWKWVFGWMNGWTDVGVDGRTDGWMNWLHWQQFVQLRIHTCHIGCPSWVSLGSTSLHYLPHTLQLNLLPPHDSFSHTYRTRHPNLSTQHLQWPSLRLLSSKTLEVPPHSYKTDRFYHYTENPPAQTGLLPPYGHDALYRLICRPPIFVAHF